MIRLRRRNTRTRSERLISSALPELPGSPPPQVILGPRPSELPSVACSTEFPLLASMGLMHLDSVNGINGSLNRALQSHGSVTLYVAQGDEDDIFRMQLQV